MNELSQRTAREAFKQTSLIGATALAACVIGIAVVAGGFGGGAAAIGPAVIALLVLVACVALGVPMMSAVRFAFVASFFFKSDISLYKLNEVEDPSGLNLSLTLLTSVVLIVHDLFEGRRREWLFPTVFAILLSGLTIAAAASVIYAGSPTLGWFSFFSFVTSVLAMYAVSVHFAERDKLLQLAYGLGIGLLFTGVMALSQYVLEFPMNLDVLGTGTEEEMAGTQAEELARVPAFLRTPTEMAWVVSSLIPVALAPLVGRERDLKFSQKLLMLAGLAAGMIAVILSLARGSWIGMVVSVPIVFLAGWLRLKKSERRDHVLVTLGVALLAGLLLVPFAPRIEERLTGDDSGSAMIRVPLMETAVRMIEDNKITGVGLNGYRENMGRYDETQMFVTRVFPNPVHNVFAHVTAEIGLPGGLFFALLILAGIAEAFRGLRSRDRLVFAIALGVSAGLFAFVVSAIKEPGSLGSVRPGMRTLFLLLGTALAVGRIQRRMLF